jgi:hypothetical protein
MQNGRYASGYIACISRFSAPPLPSVIAPTTNTRYTIAPRPMLPIMINCTLPGERTKPADGTRD